MLFNSYIFILAFLPITWLLFYIASKKKVLWIATLVLITASLFFYAFWYPPCVLLIIFSIFFNFFFGQLVNKDKPLSRVMLAIGIMVNVGLICYFKYGNFFMENIAAFLGREWTAVQIVLPLGISFFTFQQIAYLVDCYKGKIDEHNFLNYTLFVVFFPKLIAGPIVRYEELVPQFKKIQTYRLSYKNLIIGLSLFSIGLFKKVIIADGLSPWVGNTFDTDIPPTFVEAWCGALSYTFQIYFDFSGYTDMALGVGKLFNIDLPINFNSPYKASSIIDFWRRWHITLSVFFRDYLYIPLGGSKKGKLRQYVNLLVTMCICGLWHGASWTFVFWGALHGAMSCVNHFWRNISAKLNIPKMPRWVGWSVTFPCVVIAWVFFRANTLSRALCICKGMLGFNGFVLPINYLPYDLLQRIFAELGFVIAYTPNWLLSSRKEVFILLMLLVMCLVFKSSVQIIFTWLRKKPLISTVYFSFVMVVSLLSITKASEFLYFQF